MKKYVLVVLISLWSISQLKASYRFRFIFFKSGSIELDSQSYEEIKKWAIVFKKHSEYFIRLVGNTDPLECDSKDTILSYKRALVVKKVLLKEMGTDYCTKNIIIVAKGSSDPWACNETEEGRKQNRKVYLQIMQKRYLEKKGVITYSDSMSIELNKNKLDSIFSKIATLKKGDNKRIIKLTISNRFEKLLNNYITCCTDNYGCFNRKGAGTKRLFNMARKIAKKRKKQLQEYFGKFSQKIIIQYEVFPIYQTNYLEYEIYKSNCKI